MTRIDRAVRWWRACSQREREVASVAALVVTIVATDVTGLPFAALGVALVVVVFLTVPV